jgi:hypothetical protein
MMHFEVASNRNVAPQPMQANKAPQATSVLEELFILLEDYAPVWYTQEHHDRAVRALLDREN